MGMMRSADLAGSLWGRWRWLALSLIALWFALVAGSLVTVDGLAKHLTSVAHTHDVIGELHAIQSRVTDVETAQRGYILNGDSEYLEPYVDAEGDLENLLDEVQILTRDNPSQQQNLGRLRQLVGQRLDLSEAVIAAFDSQGFAEARRVAGGRGKEIHDSVRQTISTMEQIERALLGEREKAALQSRERLNWSIGFALALFGACILISWALGRARARAVEKMAQAELEYRELFEASPFPIGIVDLETQKILLTNRAAVGLYGYDQEALESMTFDRLFHSSQLSKLRDAIDTIVGGGRYPVEVWKQCRADGSKIEVEMITRRFSAHSMAKTVVIVIITDVTEREKLLSNLRHNEAELHDIFDLQYQVLATFSPDGRILRANDVFITTLGIEREELQYLNLNSLPFKSVTDGAHINPWRLSQLASQSTGPTALHLTITDAKSGEDRVFEALVRLVNHSGGSTYTIFQARDVTENVRMLDRLTTTTRRLLAAQDRAGMCIWEWDSVSKSMWWSNNSARILHIADDSLPKDIRDIKKLASPEEAPRVDAFVSNMQDAIGSSYMRFMAPGDDGHDERHFELMVERLPGAKNEEGQIVGSISDITNDITFEARLRQSQRLEAVGKLTGGVAHDFNNLLTVITGSSEVLVDELSEDPQLGELASLILAAAGRGAELTAQLLAFARRQPLEPQLASPAQLLRDMNPLLRKTLTPGIDLDIVTDAGAWKTMIDPAQLESAILNLAINSRDAMPDGGRLVIEVANTGLDAAYAAAHSDVTEGSYVMIAVSDTGTGMAPHICDRVFEPFFTTKKGGDNSGLGLSMVHGFIKQSGGHVKIYSELDSGTTVRIYLPKHSAAVDYAYPEPYLENEIRRGNERILLVEDDELVREHVAKQLVGLGYRVEVAHNGDEALRIFQNDSNFDLLFTDVVMPGGLNGRQLAKAISALAPDLPVLFTSGYTENAIVHHGRLDSGVLLLSKPYRLATLAAKLRQAFDLKVGEAGRTVVEEGTSVGGQES